VFFSNSKYSFYFWLLHRYCHFAESDAAMMQFYCNTVDPFLLLNEEVPLFGKIMLLIATF
jgi:hypothetical protein